MVTRSVIQLWAAQLLGLRQRLHAPDLDEPDRWWLSVRERILRFLVSRYADQPPERPSDAARADPAHADPAPTNELRYGWAAPPEPEPDPSGAYPPRTGADLMPGLRSVHRVNQAKRPRWRWL